jgi:hypothetical protein
MTIPSAPGTVELAKNIIKIHTNVKTYRTSLTKTINWNLKVGKTANKLPEIILRRSVFERRPLLSRRYQKNSG